MGIESGACTRPFSILNSQFSIPNAWSGPVSRILFPLRSRSEDENHSSAARVAAAVKQPTRTLERKRAVPSRPYLVLLRRGFAMPSPLTRDAVRSYRTVSPLPRCSCEQRSAVYFLLHFPSRRHAWTLSSLLPVGVRTFLHPVNETAVLRSAPHTEDNTGKRSKIPILYENSCR